MGGDKGVGVVGLCMTGNFALAVALEDDVVAAVSSEPASPAFPTNSLDLSATEKDMLANRRLDVMALRFKGDPLCRNERFRALEAVIGAQRLHEHVLPDSAKNPNGNWGCPHAVLTKDLIDGAGEITREKVNEVIAFLKARL
jgi:dienelactone hydrolase